MPENWRDFGDVPLSVYESEFAKVHSPMLAEAAAIHAAARPHSALALAMSWMEQKHGTWTEIISADHHNPMSLRGVWPNWRRFASYADGVRAWRERITDPSGPYAETTGLASLIHRYAPAFDNNNEALYEREVRGRIAAYREDAPVSGATPMKAVRMAGCDMDVMIPADMEFRIELIGDTQRNQRPGEAFRGGSASFYTQHETGNQGYGAGAVMHSRYMHNGAEGQQLGYHLTVDDTVLIQMIPLDEITWHAGDSGGDGNYDSIACELCVNADADILRARRNAEAACAGVANALTIPQARIVQHNHWSGKNCPMLIRRDGYWTTFLARVAAYRTGAEPPKKYAEPVKSVTKAWDGTDAVIGDTTLYALKRIFTVKKVTPVHQFAAQDAPTTRASLKPGDTFMTDYVFQVKTEAGTPQWWGYTPYSSRVYLGTNVEPRVTVKP